MADTQPWHYVVATEAMLAAASVTCAAAVQYDMTKGVIEILDYESGCNECVIRTVDKGNVWANKLYAKFGIAPISMDDNGSRNLYVEVLAEHVGSSFDLVEL
jgi:hypothetical protein